MDLLQTVHQANQTGCIYLTSRLGESAYINIHKGDLINAAFQHHKDAEALKAISKVDTWKFDLKADIRNAERSNKHTLTDLLLQVATALDEEASTTTKPSRREFFTLPLEGINEDESPYAQEFLYLNFHASEITKALGVNRASVIGISDNKMTFAFKSSAKSVEGVACEGHEALDSLFSVL